MGLINPRLSIKADRLGLAFLFLPGANLPPAPLPPSTPLAPLRLGLTGDRPLPPSFIVARQLSSPEGPSLSW